MTVDKNMMLLVKSNGIGEGEVDLAQKLMQNFLKTLLESGTIPDIMIFMNSGVFLTTEGTPVLDTLKEFERNGAQIVSCGTCLAYYDRKEKLVVGRSGTMKDTVEALLSHTKIIEL